MQNLEHSVIRVLNAQGTTIVGTGFVVTDHLAVTCTHVIQAAGSTCGKTVRIQFYHGASEQVVQVLEDGWSPSTNDDIAILRLDGLPEGVTRVIMGSAANCDGHDYRSFGFAKLAEFDSRKVSDTIDGVVSVRDQQKQCMIQLKGAEIDKGLSGSPVLDTNTDRVVGMVSEYKDNDQTRFAWATTSDTLTSALSHLDPTFRLWPDTFGPTELDLYLAYQIATCQRLQLPDGNEVPLERLYVSLRADEMNATEWKAEQSLHRDDVKSLRQTINVDDPYTEYEMVSRVLSRFHTPLKIAKRDVAPLFALREESALSLADVVRRHPHVVILGDPGSGKTTLGKWLVLQYARAMQQQHSHVRVRADQVRPGEAAETELDLGETRLPILIRIADYAHKRWPKEQDEDDTELPLERFLGDHEQKQDRPPLLTPSVLQAIAWQYLAEGRALVILDGLDEVADLSKRRKVMHEVKRFLRKPSSATDLSVDHWANNQVLLTSRLVGYQVEPLTDLPHYTVEDMDTEAINAFCQAWMTHILSPPLDPDTATAHRKAFIKALFDHAHPGVRTLAGNPLLLTLLAHVYWNHPQHVLPARRVELFEEATRLLYEQRKRFWASLNIPQYTLNRALGNVAAYIQSEEPTGFTNQGQAQKAVRRIFREPAQVDAVLSASGFLLARGEGVYGFLHRSLQEYFVAFHLTDSDSLEEKHEDVQAMIDRLIHYSLDPSWREPVVLAVGMISQVRHSEHDKLEDLLNALLSAPDPVSLVLPRCALLVAAALAEGERIPCGVGQRVAEQLLAGYAEQEGRGRGRSPIMQTRLQQAFRTLQRCAEPVKSETEMVLGAAVKEPDEGQRYAAIDLIIETAWDTPTLTAALVVAWKTYASPAASMLVALEGIQRRHPDCFAHAHLPLRHEQHAWVWKQAQRDMHWQAILSILYGLGEPTVAPAGVWRDSPLTPRLLKMRGQETDDASFAALLQELVATATRPGTAEARDAAFVLSVLGETDWIASYIVALQQQECLFLPLIASLVFFLRLARDLAIARDLALTRALAIARDLALTRALAIARALAHPHAHSFALEFGEVEAANDVALDLDLVKFEDVSPHDVARDLAREVAFASTRDRDLAFASTRDRDLAFASTRDLARDLLTLARALARDRELIRDLKGLLQQARQRWEEDNEITVYIDRALTSLYRLQSASHVIIPLTRVWKELFTTYGEQMAHLQVQELQTNVVPEPVIEETLPRIVQNLMSVQDDKRERARIEIIRKRITSSMGKAVIEHIATLACETTGTWQVSTHLEWSLNHIVYNEPAWLASWIEQANRTEQPEPLMTILGSMNRMTPAAMAVVTAQLPHASFKVKEALLKSLSWFVRLEHLPHQAAPSFSQDMLCLLEYDQRTRSLARSGNNTSHRQEPVPITLSVSR